MANILERLGAFRNKAITHTVCGQELKFYPPRMRMLISGRAKEIINPIGRALAVVFDTGKDDMSRQQEVEGDKVTTFVQGKNPEIIELRMKARREAIDEALGVILNDDTRYQVGELLADSLRDDFSPDEASRAKEVREFMDEIDMPTLVEFLTGYFKALAPVLNKSGNSILSDLQSTIKREVGRALGKVPAGEDEASPSEPEVAIEPMPTGGPKPEQT